MNIAYLVKNQASHDGWGAVFRGISDEIKKYGCKVKVFDNLKSIYDGRFKRVHLVRDFLRLRGEMKDVDVIHCISEPLMPLARMFGKPYIVTAHGTYAIRCLNGRYKRMYRRAYRDAFATVSVSNYVSNRLRVDSNRIQSMVINNGVASKALYASEYVPVEKRHNRFVCVGAIKKRKGQLIAVKALQEVMNDFPAVYLYLIGNADDAAYCGEIKKYCEDNRLPVLFFRNANDEFVTHCYRTSRGSIVASTNYPDSFEGFGLVHLEAQAAGTPVIGSRNCGNDDVIRDCYNGFLVEQDNVKMLSDAMKKLLADDKSWSFMSRNAIKFASLMSWDKAVRSYLYVYINAARDNTVKQEMNWYRYDG